MSDPVSPYEGLTEEELDALQRSSQIRPNEDATTWASRARLEADKAAAVAADRRKAAAEVPVTEAEPEDEARIVPPPAETEGEGSTTSTQP